VERILVATDFSTRSDRALRRAILIAGPSSAELVLIHAVDGDQPSRLVDLERTAAEDLLTEMAETIRRVDGLRCRGEVRVGDPFEALGAASRDLAADLLLMGPHRRQVLRDIFVGTTVQRVINRTGTPVLMANSVPSAAYRSILITTDL
jgi:nucleotide-binding universal stress UspA family protein